MTTQEKVPPGKYKVGEIDYSREIIIWITIVGLVLSVIGIFISLLLLLFLGIIKLPGEFQIIIDPVSPLIVMLIIGCLHEGIHGLIFRFYGKNAKYGFKFMYNVIPVFYAYSKGIFSRNQLIIVCLAPCFLITAVFSIILIMTIYQNSVWISLFLIAIILAHLAGCGGDFYLTYRLLKYPSTVIVENSGVDDPFIIWNDSELQSLNRSFTPQTSFFARYRKTIQKFCKNLIVFSCLFLFLVLLGSAILITIIPAILMLLMIKEFELLGFHYILNSTGITIYSSSLSLWPLLVISFLGTIAIYVSYRIIFSFKRKKSLENEVNDSSENENAGIPFFI